MRRSAYLFAFLIMLPIAAYAHNSGASLEASVEGGYIDVGYDPIVPYAGERIVFDFSLYTDDKKETELPFDRIWVRLEGGGSTYLATGVAKAALGPSTLLLQLPHPAPEAFKLHVRYELDGDTIAGTSFNLPISPRDPEYSRELRGGGAGLALGLLAMGAFMLFRRKR